MNRVDRNLYCMGRWRWVDEFMKWVDRVERADRNYLFGQIDLEKQR